MIEQSIGRGLRLPYGKRTGVTAVDRLTSSHTTNFRRSSTRRIDLGQPFSTSGLSPDQLEQKTVTVVSQSQLATKLGIQPEQYGQHDYCGTVIRPYLPSGRAEDRADHLSSNSQLGGPTRETTYRELSAEAGLQAQLCRKSRSVPTGTVGARRCG